MGNRTNCLIEISWQYYYTARVMLAVYGSEDSDGHTILALNQYLNVRLGVEFARIRLLTNAWYRPRLSILPGLPVPCVLEAQALDAASMEPT